MDFISQWLRENWFPLFQAAGIVGGLAFTALSIRQSTQARKVSDLLTITGMHRNLWNEAYTRPELKRIYDKNADLVAAPITPVEERFLNEVIVHFNTGWLIAKNGSLLRLSALKTDAKTFFRLPIPRGVWEQTKEQRDPKFVKFIDKCLNLNRRTAFFWNRASPRSGGRMDQLQERRRA